MTLDVEPHSLSAFIGGPTEQTRIGFTVTPDKDTSWGAYIDGSLAVGYASHAAGTRYSTYYSLAVTGAKEMRFHTFAYGTSPPSLEPTDRQPELTFAILGVGYSPSYPTLKDEETKEDVYCFAFFIKRDMPHIFNHVVGADGRPYFTNTVGLPDKPEEWWLVLERRLDDKTMYYEVIDPTTIPMDYPTIFIKKKAEEVIRIRFRIAWDGFRGILERITLYMDPLYLAFRAISAVAPEYAVWLFNLFFRSDLSFFLVGEMVAVRYVMPDVYDIDFRITPNMIKGWRVALSLLAKWLSRFFPALMLTAAAYFVLDKIVSIVAPYVKIASDLRDMADTIMKQTKEIQAKILEDPTLTAEQKTRAMESSKTFSTNVTRWMKQTATELTPPIPWGWILGIGAAAAIAFFVIFMLRRG